MQKWPRILNEPFDFAQDEHNEPHEHDSAV